jgi:hypothetical protein
MTLGAVGRGLAVAAAVALAGVGACAPGGQSQPLSTGGAGAGASGTAGTGSAGATAGVTGASGSGAGCVAPPVVHLTWIVVVPPDGAEISCADAGASTVQLLMDTTRTEFKCSDKMGTSVGLQPGTYTPHVLLASAQGTILAQGNLKPIAIPSCGTTAIGPLHFATPIVTGGSGGAGGGGTAGTSGAGGTGGAAGTSGAGGTGGGTGPCNALPIFATHSCAAVMACHDASGSAAGFNMASPGWEKNLVGKYPKAGGATGLGSVCMQSTKPYLQANSSPATGLFLDKLFANKPACGAQMPLIPPNLSAAEMDCVQRWANGLTKP